MNKFDARGRLAARFSWWHRLTGPESDELVDFFVELEAQAVQGPHEEWPGQSNIESPHNACQHRGYCKQLKAQPPLPVQPVQPAQPVQGPNSAVRTLQRLGYTDHGGQLWKPPLGSMPAWVRSAQPAPAQPLSNPKQFDQRKPLTIEEAMDLLPTNTSMSRTESLLWVLRATERAHGITDPLADGGKVMGGSAA